MNENIIRILLIICSISTGIITAFYLNNTKNIKLKAASLGSFILFFLLVLIGIYYIIF